MAVIESRPVPAQPVAFKDDIARDFGVASATYEQASRLQRLTGNAMLQTLVAGPALSSQHRILDLGCGTGWFTRRLKEFWPDCQLAGVDLSPGMIRQARQQTAADVHWLQADAESLPLPDQSFDIIFSNLMIQWCDHPEQVLRECRRLLRPGGRLVVSTLLEGTLRELKQAWQMADPGIEHVNRFTSGGHIRQLVDAALPGAELETRTIELPYRSPLELARELKHLGAVYKGAARRKTVTAPGRVNAMCRHYPAAPDGTVTASYEAAWVFWQSSPLNTATL